MSLPVLSIVAFAVAIIISCVSQINVGFLSIAFAFIIGVLFGGMKAADVAAGFPTSLFLILVGVTLFFSQANVNGTLGSYVVADGTSFPVDPTALIEQAYAVDLDGIARFAVEFSIAMRILLKMAINTLHPFLQMDVFEMHRLREFVGIGERHDLAVTIEQVAFAVAFVDRAKEPAMAVKISELCMLIF